ncbi:MAG: CDP-alcohol phosphatidyltransferase family protein [Alphaproteobacteria bacterium]|nr:CDP-alcohol phosphatidyltransferase family protein [Alphaproteobacteria bacterium]
MTEIPGPRLIIDAREDAAAAARRMLGLTLLGRLVLAAERSGFRDIMVLSPEGSRNLRVLLAAEYQVNVATVIPDAGGVITARVPANILGESDWLRALAAETVTDDACRAAGNGIFLFGPKATAAQIAAPETAAPGAPIAFTATPLQIVTALDVDTAETRLLGGLVKQTDGFMSRHFARPISIAISRRLAPHGVTPNQMTMVSALIGLAAAPFFLSSSPAVQIVGGLLFVLHSVLDGCDGELARLTYRESRLGGLLDFWGDNIVHVAVFGCMAVGWHFAEAAVWPLFLGAAAVLGTAGSAAAVYWLTLRKKTGAGPVYTSVSEGPSAGLTKLLDELSRRDFIYLVLVLSAFGKANWFLALTAIGAPVFLILVLLAARRARAADRARA